MSRFSHDKISMQKRINREIQLYDYPRITCAWKPYPKQQRPGSEQSSGWKESFFPKHYNQTLPEILADDPSFVFGFLYAKDVFFKALVELNPAPSQRTLAHQLEFIVQRARRIRPPGPNRSKREFVIVLDNDGVFQRVAVVEQGAVLKGKLRNGSRVVKRTKRLDLSLPYRFANPREGLKRMAKCFRLIFFEDTPTADELEEWFLADRNFALSDVGSHLTLQPTQRDHRLLREKYLRSVRH